MASCRYNLIGIMVAFILLLQHSHAVMKISVKPENVEVGQEITITADNTDSRNYTIKKILFTAMQRTQEYGFNVGFSVLSSNSTIVVANEPFKLSCSFNAVGPVTVTALDENNATLAIATFQAMRSRKALPTLAMFPVKANAEEYRAGETITFSFEANCHDYSLFKFTNVSLSVSAPGFGKITLYDMPAFAFQATMSPINLKPWTIPNELAYAGITTATLKFTATWPNGQENIESSIPFFIKGSLKSLPGVSVSPASENGISFEECAALVKETIATKDNQYFVYKAKVTHDIAPKICECFHMTFVALDSSNKLSIHANVLGTVGEGTVWLQGYDNQNISEKVAAFVSQRSMIVEQHSATSTAQFYVICRPKT